MSELDVDALRAEFPALRRQMDGRAVVFLDGPGGTQVPQRVIDAVAGYLTDTNANAGGAFATSEASDAMVDEAHAAVADFLGAGGPDEIKFGYNMSTLTLHIGRSIGATLGPTDEIVVTTLDHEANVSTWEAMAAERGVTVRKVDIREDDVTLDLEDLESKLNAAHQAGRGRLCQQRRRHHQPGPRDRGPGARGRGADLRRRGGVRTARPHRRPSPRHGLPRLQRVQVVRPAPGSPIWQGRGPRLAAGVQGPSRSRPIRDRARRRSSRSPGPWPRPITCATSVGARDGAPGARPATRRELVAGMTAIVGYERALVTRLIDGLGAIRGVTIHGITEPTRFDERVPTVSVSIDGVHPRNAAETLGRRGIFVWDGDFYATGLIERLGKADGGVLRLGLVHYNTDEEVDRTLEAVESIASAAVV